MVMTPSMDICILERIRRTPIQTHHLSFTLAWCVWLVVAILRSSLFVNAINPIVKPVSYLCLVVMLASRLARITNWRNEIWAVLLLAIFAIACCSANLIAMMQGVFVVYSAYDVDFKYVAKATIATLLITCLLVIVSSQTGVIQNYVGHSGERVRNFLGFRYALYPSQYTFLITCLLIYVIGEQCSLPVCLSLCVINYLIFFFTRSRLTYYLALSAVVLSWSLPRLFQLLPRMYMPVSRLMTHSFIICLALGVGITFFFSDEVAWMRTLDSDSILFGRLSMGKKALDSYGVSLFGQEVKTVGASLTEEGQQVLRSDYFYIDCAYVEMIVRYGLVPTALFIVGITKVMKESADNNDVALLIILSVVAVAFLIEDYMLYVQYNTFLLLMGKKMVPGEYPTVFKTYIPRHLKQGDDRQ